MKNMLMITLLFLAMVALPVSATTITYTFTGSNSGSLAGTAYTDAAFTITALADTATPRFPFSASFTITGVGTGTLTGSTLFVNNGQCSANPEYPDPASCVGITIGTDLLHVASNDFDTYVLGDPIGPITDTTSSGNVGNVFPTSVGDWIIGAYGPATFTAGIGQVPEPASLALLGLGLAGLGFSRRKKA